MSPMPQLRLPLLIFFPVSPILVAPSNNPTDTVRKIKDFKRRIPGNGRPYFARRCLTEDGREQFKSHWPMEILFNYLGQYQVCILSVSTEATTLTYRLAIGES
jgi:hypothetical protein